MRTMRRLLVISLLLVPGLASADYYSYTTESGTLAYTDDVKQIPARYRDEAVRHEDQSLADYARLTVVPKGASYAPDELWPLEPEAAAPETAPASEPIQLQIGGGAALTVPDAGDGPLRVKRNRYRETDDGYVRTHTIVERDGKVLAVIED